MAIGVLVMLLAALLGKRKAMAQPQAGPGAEMPAQLKPRSISHVHRESGTGS